MAEATADLDLDPDNWAYQAVTDFTRTCPITVAPDCSIDEAHEHMLGLGVHSLLVVDSPPGGVNRDVLGLVTSYDIQCRQDTLAGGAPGLRRRTPVVRVREVMTSWDDLPLIHCAALLDSTVGESSSGSDDRGRNRGRA